LPTKLILRKNQFVLIKLKFQVDQTSARKRLDKFVFDNIGTLSRMYLAGQIENGFCRVNGEIGLGGSKLQENDWVEIEIDNSVQTAMLPEDLPLDIVFEDAEIIVVNKPAEMLVHPTHLVKTGTLANALAFHLNFLPQKILRNTGEYSEENPKSETRNPQLIRPGLVHRLDKQTSGLMVAAKTERALRILSNHFERKLIEKRYLAVVTGKVTEKGKIIAPIGRAAGEKPHWRVLPDGKEAETNFRVLERRAQTTLLELEPVTGRTNQLRIHCEYAGFPIVGDTERGGREFERLCLHAAKLSFYHPNGGWLSFESKLPPDFAR
jgi:23S rRNA pseudouridine1911/1915/1917 synthase